MPMYTEVAKLSLPFLAQGVAETIVTVDQFLSLLPVRNVAPAIQYQYVQEATIAAGNSGSVIHQDGTFTPLSSSFTSTTQNLTTVGASFNLQNALATPEAVATELTKKAKAVGRKMGALVIEGVSGVGNVNFTGISGSCAANASQHLVVHTDGSGSFSFGKLDQVIDAVYPKANMLVSNAEGIRYFKNALRTTGTPAEYLQYENYGAPVLSYAGIPFVQSDFIKGDGTGSQIYAVYANEVDGVTLWSNMDQLVSVIGPTPVVNSVSSNYTVGSVFGMVIPSYLNVARLHGIIA